MQVILKIDTTAQDGSVTASWSKMSGFRAYTVPAVGIGIDLDNGLQGLVVRVKDVVVTMDAQRATVWLQPIPHDPDTVELLRSFDFMTFDEL